jgi:hypothetical protein
VSPGIDRNRQSLLLGGHASCGCGQAGNYGAKKDFARFPSVVAHRSSDFHFMFRFATVMSERLEQGTPGVKRDRKPHWFLEISGVQGDNSASSRDGFLAAETSCFHQNCWEA